MNKTKTERLARISPTKGSHQGIIQKISIGILLLFISSGVSAYCSHDNLNIDRAINGEVRIDQVNLCWNGRGNPILDFRAASLNGKKKFTGVESAPWVTLDFYDHRGIRMFTLDSEYQEILASVRQCGGYQQHHTRLRLPYWVNRRTVSHVSASIGGSRGRRC